MIDYPVIDPVAIKIGVVQVHWYGLAYLFGFSMSFLLGNYRARKSSGVWTKQQVSDLVFYSALGVIIGGRLGYVLFYNFHSFMEYPLSLFYVWEGGMSFHGGVVGELVVMFFYSRNTNKSYMSVADFLTPLIPIGLAAGRIGNFIGGELWGRASTVPWAMVFPRDVEQVARHPSQIYQALLEGVLLFIILWWFSSKPRPRMAVSGLFLLGYGAFRCISELFRQPDLQLGFIAFDWLTMGQLLSIPMILVGLYMMVIAYRRNYE